LAAPEFKGRDTLRSMLLDKLAKRFNEAKLGGSETDSPAFS
jgi:hypothetical protein